MKILIIKLGALGDVIMSTSIIKRISEHHHNDEIWLMTSPAYVSLFHNWHKKLRIISVARKGLLLLWRSISWIRSHGFDRCYDLQSNDRTSIICALSGIPVRAGNHPRFPYHFHPQEKYVGQCHSQERLKQILTSVGIEPSEEPPYLPVSTFSRYKVAAWLEQNRLPDGKFVIMHAGASAKHTSKRWPYYLQLARELQKYRLKTVWSGGKDDYDINVRLSANIGVDITNIFDILEEAELGRHASFAVTNDSAPMHILSCSDIPVFGIFGPTNWRRSHAVGQKKHIIALDTDKNKDDYTFVPADINRISSVMVMDKLKQAGVIP